MEKAVNIIRKKGAIEVVVSTIALVLFHILSKIKIIWLKTRSYNIHFNTDIDISSRFFSSNKGAIEIEEKCFIGRNVDITAGRDGQILIHKRTNINQRTIIDIHNKLEIGENSLIAPDCYICDYDHRYDNSQKAIRDQGYKSAPIVIGNNVWVGAKCIILKNVTIGNNVVIGAGSVVTKDIPDNVVVAGLPVRVIKKIVF
jgi:acetyltransferase-like isoleucine patch superfamily enzyme